MGSASDRRILRPGLVLIIHLPRNWLELLPMRITLACAVGLFLGFGLQSISAQEPVVRILPRDEKHVPIPDVTTLPHARIPDLPPPPTVTAPEQSVNPMPMGLDEALQTALKNTTVVRILTGTGAASSGQTIYDAAETLPTIDEAKARFDPTLSVKNTFARSNEPSGSPNPVDPTTAAILGFAANSYDMNMNLSKINSYGGTTSLTVDSNPSWSPPNPLFIPLNPQSRWSTELKYTQPLLKGGGLPYNMAPIIIARLNTEVSFFQFKASLQQSVAGVIQAYWNLVFARTDVWARQRQVEQGSEALRRAQARFQAGLADVAEVAQARTALANYKATEIASAANVLNQEATLANILGLPPEGHIVPMSSPDSIRLQTDWDALLRLAEVHRPDVIEFKLILEADRQSLLQARNQARPQLDGVMLYRWNGLEGTVSNGTDISTKPGQYGEWTIGLNFSVPLGLRQGRAALRQQELILARDRANLDQSLHNATHLVALRVRNLAQYYDQYLAYRDARVAARINLDRQLENYRRGRTIMLNVLQAITDWGNSVSSESQSLTQYNAELAYLEQETGTILETHGISFYEDRYCSLGPLGAVGHKKSYPLGTRPTPNTPKYPQGTQPGEEFFDLKDPLKANPPK
jgi:outer membrane protein TolC